MITCKELPNQTFASKEEMFKALVLNMGGILELKKNAFKVSDDFCFSYIEEVKDEQVVKANLPVANADITELKVKVVMNTIGLLDSHGDVHIKGIWKRTLGQSNRKFHLQEHRREFDKVISNDAEAYTRVLSWKTLGADYEGTTEALIFDSVVKQSRNPLMFEQYKNGWVTSHSVGMSYLDMAYCINSEEDWARTYKENWDKYYPLVANKEMADARGYFNAVLEAKLVEGSAVLMGSNFITPTLDNNMKSAPVAPSLENVDSSLDTPVKSYYSGLLN